MAHFDNSKRGVENLTISFRSKIVRQISYFLKCLINIVADLLNDKIIYLTGLFPKNYPSRYAADTS